MTGIFDSGVGGLAALAELRRLKPKADICYLADSQNAPYGTKSKEQLRDLVCRDIDRLYAEGCENILIACCTASTVYSSLPAEYKRLSVPIIASSCRDAVKISDSKKIGVIATEATVASGSFQKEIKRICPSAEVISVAAQCLVNIIEGGECDENLSDSARRMIEEQLLPFSRFGCDLLILGCTHFTHIKGTAEQILKIKTLSPALVGAKLISARTKNEGDGKTLYISL